MKYLAVKNFARFQHYRDRDPTWIKLYYALLDDDEFMGLPEAARMQLIGVWLLASRRANRVPYDRRFLRDKLAIRGTLHVDRLVSAKFLSLAEDSASALLEKPERDAIPRARGRAVAADEEEENNCTTAQDLSTTTAAARADSVIDIGVENASEDATVRFLEAVPVARLPYWKALLTGWLKGQDFPAGKAPTATELATGLAEYMAAGGDFSPRHVRGFVTQAIARARGDAANGRAPPYHRGRTAMDRTLENARQFVEQADAREREVGR